MYMRFKKKMAAQFCITELLKPLGDPVPCGLLSKICGINFLGKVSAMDSKLLKGAWPLNLGLQWNDRYPLQF